MAYNNKLKKTSANDTPYVIVFLNVLVILGGAVQWLINPYYISELVRNSTVGKYVLMVLAILMIIGIALYWNGFQKGKINKPIDYIIYAFLPVMSGIFLFLLILIFTQNETDYPPSLPSFESVLTYRLETLENTISGKANLAKQKIRKIDTVLSIEENNQKILDLEKQKARLEGALDQLKLLEPAVEDLADRIVRSETENNRVAKNLKELLKKYEDIVTHTQLD